MGLLAAAGRAPLNIVGFSETTDGTPLAARVLLLDDGQIRLALVSLTVICLTREQSQAVEAAVAEASGARQVTVACTHVHSGPPVFSTDAGLRRELSAQLARAAAAAACQAVELLQPASLARAAAGLPGVSRVRRILRRDGTVITLRRAWPQWWGWATDPETVGPEEPLDDLLTVLRVDDATGQPLAALLHFSCHPIPDFFGHAAALVESHLDVPCLLLNGCQGNVDTPFEVPLRGRTQAAQLPVLGDIMGYRSLELLTRAETMTRQEVGAVRRAVFLPVEEAFLADPGEQGLIWPEAVAAGGFDTVTDTLLLGELALVTAPGEVPVSFGQQVAALSPIPQTRVVGLGNDECGYMLSAEARARGGYEADAQTWGVVTAEGLGRLLEAMAECLGEVGRYSE